MNKCNITEEETTKAVHASYQLPVPVLVTNGHHDVANSGVVIAGSQHLQNNHDSGEHAIFGVAKKRPKAMDVPLPPGPLMTNHLRENQEFPMQRRSLGDMKSNVLNKSVLNESQMLTDVAEENQNNKQREKKKVVDRLSDGGAFFYPHVMLSPVKIYTFFTINNENCYYFPILFLFVNDNFLY